MNASLIIMAAGMGSRYGGLKQIDPLGPSGEILMEYAVYDAIRAGFNKVIFVIRKDFESEFKKSIGDKFLNHIDVCYAFQELENLPVGYNLPEGRTKPWGTGQAILSCKEFINSSFVVQNADDYYGQDAYKIIYDGFKKIRNDNCCLVGYPIAKTLSPNGSVTRGICHIKDDKLVEINERKHIERTPNHKICYLENDHYMELDEDSICSMNFWGFPSSYINKLEDKFIEFLKIYGKEKTSEWLIPDIVDQSIKSKESSFQVLSSNSNWFGVTYPEDKKHVMNLLSELHKTNIYPANLWL